MEWWFCLFDCGDDEEVVLRGSRSYTVEKETMVFSRCRSGVEDVEKQMIKVQKEGIVEGVCRVVLRVVRIDGTEYKGLRKASFSRFLSVLWKRT